MTSEAPRRFKFAPLLTATIVTLLVLYLVGTVANVLVLLFVGVLVSLYLRALAGVIERRTKLRDRWAFAAALTLTIAAVAALVSILVPPVVQQTQQLYSGLPDYLSGWEAGLDRLAVKYPGLKGVIGEGDQRIVRAIYDRAMEGAGQLLPRALGVVRVAIDMFAVAVIAIYLSLNPAQYRDWVVYLFPDTQRATVRSIMTDLGSTLRAWIVGQLLTMFVLGLLTAIGLWALGVPFSLAFGLFAGLVAIIPFFGTLVSTVLPALFVLNGDGIGSLGAFGHSILVMLLGAIVHIIGAYFVMPLIMQNKVNLPPVHVLVAVLVMGQLLGAMGLVIAVPALAVGMVVLRHVGPNHAPAEPQVAA